METEAPKKPPKNANCRGACRTAGPLRHNRPEIASIKNLYSIFRQPPGKVELDFPIILLNLHDLIGNLGLSFRAERSLAPPSFSLSIFQTRGATIMQWIQELLGLSL